MAVSRKSTKKCSRGRAGVKSHRRSSGKLVKAHCRKVSRKGSHHKRSHKSSKSYGFSSHKVSHKRSRKGSKKSSHKVSRKGSKKGSFRRIKKSPSNPCSMLKKRSCSGNPNCHYVSRRGCARRKGVATKGVSYAGPVTAQAAFEVLP